MLRATLALIPLVFLFSNSYAENWPRWRGPEGSGVAADGSYPAEFSATEGIEWKIKLPGRGSSTPVVWDSHILVTCPIDGKDGVVCYDFTGSELWSQAFDSERKGKHRNGSGSNPSPVTNGSQAVVYYKSGTIACVDFAGNLLWQHNLQEMFGEDTLWWDLGTSPVIAAGNVVVAVMQSDDSFLVALDLANGKVAWKQERIFPCQKESDHSYTTPNVLTLEGREVIVTWGADHLTGHDAQTGKPLWQCGGFNPEDESNWRVIASAAADNDIAVVPYGRGEFIAGVSLKNAKDDITTTHRLWEKVELGTDVPTPVIVGDRIILLTDKGEVYGLEKLTGEQLWTGRLPKAKDKYYASPVLAGDRLYCAREDGVIMSCLIDDGLHEIKQNDMDESVIATPIPILGKLLVRGEQHLFLIGK